jgi:hypothetical protein
VLDADWEAACAAEDAPAEVVEPESQQETTFEPEPAGWAPAPSIPVEAPPEPFSSGDLRPALPAETLQFGAVSPSALARG